MWDIPYPFIALIKLKGNKISQVIFISPFSWHITLSPLFLSFPSFLPSLSHLRSITHVHFMRKRVSDWLREKVMSEGEEEEEEEEKRKKRVSENSI
jgi:hypothetical protein